MPAFVSMEYQRPSILNRPIRPSSGRNKETTETQFAREQEYWKNRAARLQAAEERLRKGLHPTSVDKQEYAAELAADLNMRKKLREQEKPLPAPASAPYESVGILPGLGKLDPPSTTSSKAAANVVRPPPPWAWDT